jgi:nuclear transport factor 2 (NTF2) superfamily protein
MRIAPRFTLESATKKIQLAKDAWNRRGPQRVALAGSADSEWRNRKEFIRRKRTELDHRLKNTLRCFHERRMDGDGPMRRRHAGIKDAAFAPEERRAL